MPSGRPHPCARLTLLLALAVAAIAPLDASAASGFKRDRTPLPADVSGAGTTSGHSTSVQAASGTGGAALRMLFGLAIVLAIIFVLYKVLKRSARKNDRTVDAHGGMTVVASTPLAPSRSLHLVRVGEELVLVGAAEQGVTPIRVYAADEVRRLGFDADPGTQAPFAPMGMLGPGPGAARPGFGAALVETLRRMTAR